MKYILTYFEDQKESFSVRKESVQKKWVLVFGKLIIVSIKLIVKVLEKLKNFSNNKNKKNYYYLLTPKGVEKKKIDFSFLKSKMDQYEITKGEIDKLTKDIEKIKSVNKQPTL